MSDVRESHDRGAKLLLSHPRVVSDLLRAFVAQEWLLEVNLPSMQQLPTERLSRQLARRVGDIVWIAPCDGDEGEMVIMIEAQSTIDPTMALRMATLVAMFYEERARRRAGILLPQVLPIVYYSGRAPWNAAISISEMTSHKRPSLPFMRHPCYLLLEVRQMVESGVIVERNTASLMMRMEAARDGEELLDLLAESVEWLGKLDRPLWTEFVSWAAIALVPRRFPGLKLDRLRDYVEGIDMLAENMREWREKELRRMREQVLEQGLQQGRELGLAKGRSEGEQQGQRKLLENLAARKFGERSATRLSRFLATSPHSLGLSHASDWILDCRTEQEFLNHLDAGV